MSIVTDIRSYTDIAVEQGRSALTKAQEQLTTASTDAREQANTAATDAKEIAANLFALYMKQAYAAIGASDVVIEKLNKRAEELPADVLRTTTKISETARERVTKATEAAESATALGQSYVNKAANQAQERVAELRKRGEEVVEAARNFEPTLPSVPTISVPNVDPKATASKLKGEFDAFFEQAATTYTALAERGEKVAADLRRDPKILRLRTDADKLAERAANELTSVAQKVRYRASKDARSTNAKKGAVTRAANAAKTPAVKVTAKKASAATSTTAKKASTATKTTASKAATATKATTTKTAAEPTATARHAATAPAKTPAAKVAPDSATPATTTPVSTTPAATTRATGTDA